MFKLKAEEEEEGTPCAGQADELCAEAKREPARLSLSSLPLLPQQEVTLWLGFFWRRYGGLDRDSLVWH